MSDGEFIADLKRRAAAEDTIVSLFSETERVALRRYEESTTEDLVARLTPTVKNFLERTCGLLSGVMTRYDNSGDDEGGFGELFDEAELNTTAEIVPLRSNTGASLQAPKSPAAAIGDLAFVALAELRQHQHRLQAHRPTFEKKELISDCGSALRAIRKSLYALEPLLCEVEQTPRMLPPRLGSSLEVRRQYRKLWSCAAEAGAVDAANVRASLRRAGTRIAMLTGSEIYNQLREDDRFRIRELQERILDWLRDGDEHDARGGVLAVQLWQDFALFVEMLRQVNLREELIEHDRKVMRAAAEELRRGGESEVNAVCDMLNSPIGVVGLDDSLDDLLRRGPSAAALLRELSRVRGSLQDAQAAAAPASTTVAL